ncbi:MAG: DUF2793 domain-containing protein [Amylibacter sp.]|nr:DUF2793 domain-containing protein [Amylibacter sp.]
MTENSHRLTLPYLQASQAQKHVTHNEALRQLDVVVQTSAIEVGATSPPSTPANGDTYALGNSVTGAWAGQDGNLATWDDGTWLFSTPQPGWRIANLASGELLIWNGTNWVLPATKTQELDGIGINATSDNTNRLSVSAPATLLNNEGSGHQLKINKATTADTASVMFQTGFSGRAELGLTGDDDLNLKVSGDGAVWKTALKIDQDRATMLVPGLNSGTLTIANDSIGILTPPWTGGFVLLTIVHASFPQASHSGILVYNVGSSPLLATMSLAANMTNLGTTVLTGTTGTTGKTSVAAANGQIVIENRFGSARIYSYTFLGGEL